MTRTQRTGELSEDIRALQENPDCTKEPLCKYIFSVDVYEDLIGIRSTADWAKGNADVPFMKEVKTNYAASNEADGVIIDVMRDQFRYMLKIGKIESWSGFELFQPYFLLTISREREEARDF